jgi:glutathione S-transferase
MNEVILHHFAASPFAEKVRTALGIKGLAWRSVEIPHIMPKPDLMPLTGGYRMTPVMQIGADIYCDTQRILREIEARYPSPSLYSGTNAGLLWTLSRWSDKELFDTVIKLTFGVIGDNFPDDFINDRSAQYGVPFDIKEMKAAAPLLLDQLRAFLDWTEIMVADGPFVMGKTVGLADLNTYFILWWFRRRHPDATALLDPFPKVRTWMDRMESIGHGKVEAMDAQQALDIARVSESEVERTEDIGDPSGHKPGDRVSVVPVDTFRVPVSGELVSSGAQHIAIRRRDDRVGKLVVHFPRVGYQLLPITE